MNDGSSSETHLATRYVFLDTQAVRSEKLDWNGKRLAKLRELAKNGQIAILTTAITKREIKEQISELLAEAKKHVGKSSAVLSQLGHQEAVLALDAEDAKQKLETVMEIYFLEAKAVDVPISISTEELFQAYFDRKPPFSDKKKSEFPDAAVVASLTSWCKVRKAKAYVVSADPDMKACCASSDCLISVDSVADILTLVAVSKEFLDALSKALESNDYLTERLAEQVREDDVEGPRYGFMNSAGRVTGKVERIDGISIFNVEVVERDGPRLVLEVSFEAEIVLDLEIEVEDEYEYGFDGHGPTSRFSREKTLHRISYAEVVLSEFDPARPDDLEFESVYTPSRPIELRPEDVPSQRDMW